jgi:hypothetical protein
MVATDKRTKTITNKINRMLGYERPRFTAEEVFWKRKYEAYINWTPGMKIYNGESFTPELVAEPEKVKLSYQLLEKIEMYNEWVREFNRHY